MLTEQQQIESDLDAATRFGHAVAFVWGIAFLIIVCLFCATHAWAQTTGSGSLTIATEPVIATPGQIISRLTWTTSPAGATCTASGDWTGAKAANGTEALPPATPPRAYSLRCTWAGDAQAVLTWTAPTANSDGSALAKCATSTETGTCLAKYRILHGTSATALTDVRDHNFPNATTATWTALTPGTHFFAIKAVNGQGVESPQSAVVSKTASAGTEWSASVGLKVPNTATNVEVQ
jgi:hypothetical protein